MRDSRREAALGLATRCDAAELLDGFRGLLRHGTNGHVHVLSRNLRDLAPSFPELIQAARSLPPGTLLDGEICIADESGNADFGALQ
jgi:ATP-dependent DNA ligase